MSFSLLHPATIAFLAALVYALSAVRELIRIRNRTTAELSAAEARVRDIERRLIDITGQCDSLIELSGIGVLVLDSAGIILRGNAKAAAWLHTTVAAMVGRNLLEATLSHELESVFLDARRVGCVNHELRVTGLGGANDLVVTVAPVETTLERKRYLMIIENVTQLRRLETVRRDFVANVSHELRTPLTSIRAVAETLQQAPLQDRDMVDRFLNMIVAESERLTRISDDLLVLSSAESRPPQKDKIDLGGLVSTVANRLQRQANKSGIMLTTSITGSAYVLANHDQIEQVVVNLIDNAIKYTHESGKVKVAVESHNDAVYVHVTDTGIGIMQQDLSRIFERFYRVDKARSRETGGTGLGLSIVKHIVESHGGQVTVESEYNRGSTFTIMLPAADYEIVSGEGILTE
jgi:two-component system phosphate regulon sensor histidine kinase PhoR